MKTKVFLIALMMLTLVIFVGCMPYEGGSTTLDKSPSSSVNNLSTVFSGTKIYSDSEFTVVRFDDYEKGITCYLMDGYESGGIECLPTP